MASTTVLFATRISVEEGDGTRETLSLVEAACCSDDEVREDCSRLSQHPEEEVAALISVAGTDSCGINASLQPEKPKISSNKKAPESPSESPVAVALRSFFKSTISCDDTGAEVTLQEEGSSGILEEAIHKDNIYKMIGSMITPEKSRTPSHATRASSSHLDFDPTLVENSIIAAPLVSPESPDTPMKTPFCGLYGCCPIAAHMRSAEIRCGRIESFYLRGCIVDSLGDCHNDEEAWQQMIPAGAIWEQDEEGHENESPMTSHQARVMHNRTLHGRHKSDHLSKLRKDLDPFGSSSNNGLYSFTRARTFSVSQSVPGPSRKHDNVQEDAASAANDFSWQWSCTPVISSPIKSPRWLGEVDQNACYDSDPEDYQETKFQRSFSPRNYSDLDSRYSVNHDDEIAMQDLIQEVFKERWTLILHPENGSPVGVEAWLERGHRMQRVTLPPKLVWLPLHEKTRNEKIGLSYFTGVDLLDIQRILEVRIGAVTIDRKKHPFVKPRRTFILRSLTGTYWLEARSMAERDRIVRQLKLTVARFGSLLVSNDPGVEDFFVPMGHVRAVDPNESL